MTKKDIVNHIAHQEGMTKVAAGKLVEAFMSAITTALANGDNIILPNFGSFSTVRRAERRCRNPQTGESIIIPSKQSVKFKPAGKLAAKVNNHR